MTGRVDQVQLELFPLAIGVRDGNGVAFDGDAPFSLDIHVVQDLIPEMTIIHHVRHLNHSIRQGGLPMVDMGDDTEIPDVMHRYEVSIDKLSGTASDQFE